VTTPGPIPPDVRARMDRDRAEAMAKAEVKVDVVHAHLMTVLSMLRQCDLFHFRREVEARLEAALAEMESGSGRAIEPPDRVTIAYREAREWSGESLEDTRPRAGFVAKAQRLEAACREAVRLLLRVSPPTYSVSPFTRDAVIQLLSDALEAP
jgi:hypothetical protein